MIDKGIEGLEAKKIIRKFKQKKMRIWLRGFTYVDVILKEDVDNNDWCLNVMKNGVWVKDGSEWIMPYSILKIVPRDYEYEEIEL